MASSIRCLWLLILCFFSYFNFQSSAEEVSPRVFLYPQSKKITSIVSKEYRTAFHFQPAKNWINDPNGPMYYNGIYHIFYQYNPNGSSKGKHMYWGHSASTDLINWAPLDLAISPSKPFDIYGCWSGSATILPGNKPVILYTGLLNSLKHQVQNIALPKNLSDPLLTEWTKPDYNPLMAPVDDIKPRLFRDPSTGWLGADNHWRVVVGAEIEQMGVALLYKSEDFVHWVRAEAPLHFSNGSRMWECPDFYPVSLVGKQGLDTSVNSDDVKHVLKMSLGKTDSDHYMLGKYYDEKDVFVPDILADDYRMWRRYDYGKFYASKTFFDAKNKRRILWGWLNESDSVSEDIAKGWAGIQIVPRTIWLDTGQDQLKQWPIQEVESLRKIKVYLKDIEINTGGLLDIKGIKASQADVEVLFQLQSLQRAENFDSSWLLDPPKLCSQEDPSVQGSVGPFGLLVLASSNLEEYTAVFFRVYQDDTIYRILMCADQRRSSLRSEVDKPVYGVFLDMDLEKERTISLRTLIDHSVIENFGGGGRACITARVFPALLLNSSIHLYAFNNGTESVLVEGLQAWEMSKARMNLRPDNLLEPRM